MRLGKTNLEVNKNGFGALPIQRRNIKDSVEILQYAYEHGIDFYDTAHFYTDSEAKIGKALEDVRENIYLASKLFKRLYEKRRFTTQDVVNMAYEIHLQGNNNDIEFIIASCEDGNLSLHCIKEHEIINDCIFAWIGSPIAHSEFQALRNKDNTGKASDRTSTAFLGIVQGCSDESVGGFCISVGYNRVANAFGFRECKTFQNTKQQVVKAGDKIKFHMSAEDGGFSFEQIPISEEEFLLTIDQMEPAILYSRRLRMCDRDRNNIQLFSLMLPMLICEDENGNWKRV